MAPPGSAGASPNNHVIQLSEEVTAGSMALSMLLEIVAAFLPAGSVEEVALFYSEENVFFIEPLP